MEISITRGLKELSLLDKRIEDAIEKGIFIGYAKKSSDKINNTYTRAEFEKLVTSNFDSVEALMKRRIEFKSKIVESNSKTIVSIGGVEYTVAAALEMKQLIEHKKCLLSTLEKQYREANKVVSRENEKVDEKVFLMLKDVNTDENSSGDLTDNSFITQYRKNYEFDLINPAKIHDKIALLKKEIEDFENEVDFVLSESNAITKIIVSDC